MQENESATRKLQLKSVYFNLILISRYVHEACSLQPQKTIYSRIEQLTIAIDESKGNIPHLAQFFITRKEHKCRYTRYPMGLRCFRKVIDIYLNELQARLRFAYSLKY